MKIAIIAHHKFPLKEPYQGGLEMITHALIKELIQIGHEVDVYAKEESECEGLSTPQLNSIIARKFYSKDDAEQIMENIAYSKMFLHIDQKQYDIIHNHSLHYLPIILGEELDTPFITSLHTPAFPELQIALNCIGNRPNTYFTSVSNSLKNNYLKRIGINSEVIYNGIAVHKWSFDLENTADYCFWYGRICKEKAPEMAIQVAKKANVKLLLAGPGEDSDYFRDYIKPELNNEIKYLGHLSQDEINEYLKLARALLFTSVWEEPYGLTIAESLACGTPVVSWNLGAAPEIITEETGYLIDEIDPDAMAAILKEVQFLNRRECRERAEEFCAISSMVMAYENLYKSILAQKI